MRQGKLIGLVIVTASIIGIVAAGCGGSGSSASTSTTTTMTVSTTATRKSPPLTKAKFLAKANTICMVANKLIEAAGKKTLPSNEQTKPTPAQLPGYAKLVTPILLNQLELIRALGAPPEDKAKITKMLNALGAEAEKVQAEPSLLNKPNAFANFAKLAHPYGLTSCAPGRGL